LGQQAHPGTEETTEINQKIDFRLPDFLCEFRIILGPGLMPVERGALVASRAGIFRLVQGKAMHGKLGGIVMLEDGENEPTHGMIFEIVGEIA
jgi:hypothetical protein